MANRSDYGGTCDTCANGRATIGQRQCAHCQAAREAEEEWEWVQPSSTADLLERLALARDTAVDVREMENLCAEAHAEIARNGVLLREMTIELLAARADLATRCACQCGDDEVLVVECNGHREIREERDRLREDTRG